MQFDGPALRCSQDLKVIPNTNRNSLPVGVTRGFLSNRFYRVGRSDMRVLHVNNQHRGVGGSDAACHSVMAMCKSRGMDIGFFEKDSRDLPTGIKGKAIAFFGGIYSPSGVRDFEQFLQNFQPDVVHVHELFPLISPWILPRCTAAGIPVVMTCYDFRITCPVATHHNKDGVGHACN